MPEPAVEVEITNFDKFLHTIVYALLAYLCLRALLNYGYSTSRIRLMLAAIAMSTLYGISDEIHQLFVPGRDACAVDAFFNFFGSIIGAYMYKHRVESLTLLGKDNNGANKTV